MHQSESDKRLNHREKTGEDMQKLTSFSVHLPARLSKQPYPHSNPSFQNITRCRFQNLKQAH